VAEIIIKKNKNIMNANDLLQIISQDDNARMPNGSKETKIHDQLTMDKAAEERCKREYRMECKIEVARNLLKLGVSIYVIIKALGLSEKKLMQLKKELEVNKN